VSTPTLRISSGPAAGQSVEIEGEVVIGRENADLTIEDTELSRRHVALRPVEGGIEIEDLGSLNGTFVNGQRISSPTTLTVSGMLKIGGSQVNLEISFPQATRMAQTPEAGSEVAPPGATVARAIPEPVADADVTAQRPVVDPDVTAQRPLVDPNVTVQRPVPSDATAKPSSPQGPDVTVKRPVGSAGPPPGTVRPPAPPSPPAEGTSGRSKGPPVPLIVGLVLLVVVVVLVLLLTSGGGAEAQTRKASAEEVLRPEKDNPPFKNEKDLREAYEDRDLLRLPEEPRALGFRVDKGLGVTLARRLKVDKRLYRGLRPDALATLLYLAKEVRQISGVKRPVVFTSGVRDLPYQKALTGVNSQATTGFSLHTTGHAFDLLRPKSRPQHRAIEHVLERLRALHVIDWVYEPAAFHLTVGEEGEAFLPLLEVLAQESSP